MSWIAILRRVRNWVRTRKSLTEHYTPSIKFDFYGELRSKCSELRPRVLAREIISPWDSTATWTDAAVAVSLNFSLLRFLRRSPRIDLLVHASMRFVHPGDATYPVPSHSQLNATSRELQNVTVRAHSSQWKTWKMVLLILRNFSSRLYRLPTSTRSQCHRCEQSFSLALLYC